MNDTTNHHQKIKEAHEHLESLTWDDYTQRLFGFARFASRARTKNLSGDEAEYITDGLNYRDRFRRDWEGREEFMWRFLDVLVGRGEASLLLSAAIAASQRGIDWNNKPQPMAEITYEQWAKEANQRIEHVQQQQRQEQRQ